MYECGEQPIGTAWVQFDLRFYVVALLFIIFDVEVVFFFPWAVVFGNTMQLADRNLSNLEGLTKPLGERGPQLIASLDRSVGQLDTVLGQVAMFTQALNNSEGSLARLVKDPALYEQVASMVANLNELTQKLKPIVNDVRTFTDKAARHPEQFGARGLIQGNSGIK